MNKIKWLKRHVLMVVIGTFLLGSTAAFGFSYQFVLARNQVASTSSPVGWYGNLYTNVRQTYASIASGHTQYSVCNDANTSQIVSTGDIVSNASSELIGLEMLVQYCEMVRLRVASWEYGSGSYEVHGAWSPNEAVR